MQSVKELRQTTGLSQSKFAKKFHLNINTLQSWEQGKTKTPDWYLFILNEYFKLR